MSKCLLTLFLEHFNTLDDKQNIAFTNNYIFTREPNAGMVVKTVKIRHLLLKH